MEKGQMENQKQSEIGVWSDMPGKCVHRGKQGSRKRETGGLAGEVSETQLGATAWIWERVALQLAEAKWLEGDSATWVEGMN